MTCPVEHGKECHGPYKFCPWWNGKKCIFPAEEGDADGKQR